MHITAFVGRTVMGPPNKPVTVRSFLEYQRTFGGLWIDSPLSYSVKQYFEHGGQVAIVVRVANGATGSTLLLPGEYGSLTLTATNPGSREALRASVDYDNISSKETGRFNLLVQRVRNLGSELVAEQETYRSLSTDPESDRFVTSVLDDSNLARVAGVVPAIRPKPTVAMTAGSPVSYVDVTHHGCDGKALSDYDVIGSEVDGTGLFAVRVNMDRSP